MSAIVSAALESAEAKIVRVMKYPKAFEDCIAEYRRTKPFEVVGNPDSQQELHILTAPPLELSILTGEVVYHLRSALDHLFFELVQRNFIGPFSKKEIRNFQFPLHTAIPEDAKGTLPASREDIRIPYWIPDVPYTYIEGLQPYYRRDNRHQALRLLAKLSNIDKHRRPNTTVTRVNRRASFFN